MRPRGLRATLGAPSSIHIKAKKPRCTRPAKEYPRGVLETLGATLGATRRVESVVPRVTRAPAPPPDKKPRIYRICGAFLLSSAAAWRFVPDQPAFWRSAAARRGCRPWGHSGGSEYGAGGEGGELWGA